MIFSFVVACLTIPSPMQQSRVLIRNEDWSGAIACMKRFKPTESDQHEYWFHMAVAHCRLNHKKEAIVWAEKVADELLYPPPPRRYKAVALIIIAEAERWKEDRLDLDGIYRDMKAVQDRLKNAQAGKETQRRQKDILDRLDQMIKKEEDELEKAKSMAQAKQQQKQKSKPADDFQLPQGEKYKGEVDAKRVKEYAAIWGNLPPKERAKAMVELTRGLPSRYRNAIETYFKNLEKKR